MIIKTHDRIMFLMCILISIFIVSSYYIFHYKLLQITYNSHVLVLKNANSLKIKHLKKNDKIDFVTGTENLPINLQFIPVPEPLRVDALGNLIIDHILRDFFDFFLSAEEDKEESMVSIQSRIKSYLIHNLPFKAAYQGIVIMNQYIAYKKALSNEQAKITNNNEEILFLQLPLKHFKKLRATYLSPDVVAAFFGNDIDQQDSYFFKKIIYFINYKEAVKSSYEIPYNEKKQLIQRLRYSIFDYQLPHLHAIIDYQKFVKYIESVD